MKKAVTIMLFCLAGVLLLAAVNFIPTLSLATPSMTMLRAEHFNIHYEPSDQSAAEDLSRRLTKGYEKIADAVALTSEHRTEVYVYPSIGVFHTKKYGLLGALVAPDWYIGDNIRDTVVIASPSSPGKAHTYESVAEAAVHEYVHTLLWRINPKLKKFLSEGMAGYISGNTKVDGVLTSKPSFEDTQVSDPVEFGNSGLYPVSYTYIEFLCDTYGMPNVLKLMRTEDYATVFGKSEKDIYEEWIAYYEANYMENSSCVGGIG